MALLTAVNVGLGTLSAPVAVNSSDAISSGDIALGAILEVKNGSGGSINVTVTDPGLTPAGNTGTQAAVAVAAGTTRRFQIPSTYVNQSTQVATVTYSGTTSVTCELYY